MTQEERDAARADSAGASAGPWRVGAAYEQADPGLYLYSDATCSVVVSMDTLRPEDARFIARARVALPAALDEIDRLERANALLRMTLARRAADPRGFAEADRIIAERAAQVAALNGQAHQDEEAPDE